MKDSNEKVGRLIQAALSKFMQHESDYTSLITITSVTLAERGSVATIGISVLPEDKEHGALDLMKRKSKDMRNFLKKETRLARVPKLIIEIDKGEKARQRIDELSNEG